MVHSSASFYWTSSIASAPSASPSAQSGVTSRSNAYSCMNNSSHLLRNAEALGRLSAPFSSSRNDQEAHMQITLSTARHPRLGTCMRSVVMNTTRHAHKSCEHPEEGSRTWSQPM